MNRSGDFGPPAHTPPIMEKLGLLALKVMTVLIVLPAISLVYVGFRLNDRGPHKPKGC